ncbi:Stp1/IreP family PP2C-type Ser/Thr phosphatase [Acetatifactor aquisgranensis]|uniref:Stp1/IreP family PP2C-type Ser/Thr phosphatase n=1 Tax=Acetatifactor aquisgranensis TaxID=2941233 RepID=UPI0020417C2C
MNQDYVYSSEQPIGRLPNLFLVADGMGGHNAGEYASKVTVETIVEYIADSPETDAARIFDGAIHSANARIRRLAAASSLLAGMGTTVVAATCEGDRLSVANVGDSRLYIVGRRGIRQITRDHSWVEEMVQRGGIGREEARNHPDKNIITRAVGAEDTVKADFFSVRLEEGDTVLMCTDGLTNMLEDEEIRMIMNGARDIVERAQELVEAANDNGGKDNISVILIEPLA